MSISFIIPVFNSEKTIKKCLDSILLNHIEDIEIICIDDGSTDNSHVIIFNYTKKYPFIKLIRKKNEGPFIARKLGVILATKKYITFIDSDDWIEKDYIKKIQMVISKLSPDIIIFQYINDFIDKDSYISKIKLENGLHDKEKMKMNVYPLLMEDGFLNGLCNKIFRNNLFEQNDISYNFSYGEDLIYQLHLFDKAKNVYFLEENLYHYTHYNETSLSNSKINIDILINMYNIRKKYYDLWELDNDKLHNSFVYLITMVFLNAIKEQNIKELKKILQNSNIKKIFLMTTLDSEEYSKNIILGYKILTVLYRLRG